MLTQYTTHARAATTYTARTVAQRLAREVGQTLPDPGTAYAVYSPEIGAAVACWYFGAIETSAAPDVALWDQLGAAVDHQYASLLAAGITHTVVDYDPFTCAEELWAEADTGGIRTMATGEGDHPVWTAAQNDRFRFVHDILGHVAGQLRFDREGEDMAYRCHRATMPAHLWPALATETRAQNSALNFGPEVAGATPGTFAAQLAVRAPRWVAVL